MSLPTCSMYGCLELREPESYYCRDHRHKGGPVKQETQPIQQTQILNDHIKINIEQSAKGARVTVTFDRSDHNIEEAVNGAVQTYETIIEELKQRGMKVDDSKSS